MARGTSRSEGSVSAIGCSARSRRSRAGASRRRCELNLRRALIGIAGLTVALLVWQAVGVPPADPLGVEAGKDVVLYHAIRARVADGQPYYPVVAEELVRHGFPTWPVFHWRTPLVMWVITRFPWPWGATVAFLGALAAIPLAARGRGPAGIAIAAAMAGGLAVLAVPSGLLFGETWCGLALALSAAGYLFERPALRVGGGLAALALRELAALWCVLAALDALAHRRWRELAAWAAGGAVYLALYAVHVQQVVPLVPDEPVVRGWVAFGGPLHALRCMRWFVPVLIVPPLAPILIGATALAALHPPRDWPGVRFVAGAALAYLVAFAVFGRPFNDYWGCLLAALWGATAPLGVWAAAERRRP